MGYLTATMTPPNESWQVAGPKWIGKARRPIADMRGRFEMPTGGVDDFILIVPFLGWLLLVVASAIEACIHVLVVNPARWMASSAARRAGWEVEVTHVAPANPSLGPTPKRLTITTMRSPSRAAANHVRTQLINGLAPGMTLADPAIRDLLAANGTTVTAERTTYRG